MDETEPASGPPNSGPPTVSGRAVVVGMVLFGAVVVTGFWSYWYFANRPFRELQLAIVTAYPDTFPQVAGGQSRARGTTSPTTLRIVVRTLDFDPKLEEERSIEMAAQLASMAREFLDLNDFELLEIVLFHKYQEQRGAYWQRQIDLTRTPQAE